MDFLELPAGVQPLQGRLDEGAKRAIVYTGYMGDGVYRRHGRHVLGMKCPLAITKAQCHPSISKGITYPSGRSQSPLLRRLAAAVQQRVGEVGA